MAFAPKLWIAQREDGIDDRGIRIAKPDGDIMFPHIEECVISIALIRSRNAFNPCIGTFREQI